MKRKNKTNRPEILFYSAMITLYLLIVGTLLVYAEKARETSNFKTVQFAERILTDFSINYFLKKTSDYAWLNDDVRGVAIYDERGSSLVSYGQTPDTLENFVLDDRMKTEFDRASRSLIPRQYPGTGKYSGKESHLLGRGDTCLG